MKLSAIIAALEEIAPLRLQEKWDNSGLQVGLPPEADGECTGALLCLDVTEGIIGEAVARGCNLVISHHPLIFKGVKSLTGRDATQRTVAAAVRAGVAVYSSHTALDSARGGVSHRIVELLGARALAPLAAAEPSLVVFSVICPRGESDLVTQVLLENGVEECDQAYTQAASLETEDARKAEDFGFTLHHTPLCRISASAEAGRVGALSAAVASIPGGDKFRIEVTPRLNGGEPVGLGMVAVFDEPISGAELVARIKERFGTPAIKASLAFDPAATVRRIAVCGGAGGEFIGRAQALGVQAYITADVRYHDFADLAGEPLMLLDIGHFESENCFKSIFYHVIRNKFPNFAVHYADLETNPVKYL